MGLDAIPDLYSGKAKYTGMNVQIACNLKGDVAAIGPVPVHGARHDAYAFEASGLKEILQKSMAAGNTGADLGYIGVDGIGIVPFKRLSGAELLDWQREFNTIFSKIRATVEHAVAKVKTWRMLSREGGRYRCPIDSSRTCLKPSPDFSSSPNTVMINELTPRHGFVVFASPSFTPTMPNAWRDGSVLPHCGYETSFPLGVPLVPAA